jgi:hypothetical protein
MDARSLINYRSIFFALAGKTTSATYLNKPNYTQNTRMYDDQSSHGRLCQLQAEKQNLLPAGRSTSRHKAPLADCYLFTALRPPTSYFITSKRDRPNSLLSWRRQAREEEPENGRRA